MQGAVDGQPPPPPVDEQLQGAVGGQPPPPPGRNSHLNLNVLFGAETPSEYFQYFCLLNLLLLGHDLILGDLTPFNPAQILAMNEVSYRRHMLQRAERAANSAPGVGSLYERHNDPDTSMPSVHSGGSDSPMSISPSTTAAPESHPDEYNLLPFTTESRQSELHGRPVVFQHVGDHNLVLFYPESTELHVTVIQPNGLTAVVPIGPGNYFIYL